MNVTILPLFSTPIYYIEDIGYALNKQEKKYIDSLSNSKTDTTRNWLSENQYVLEDKKLQKIKEICQKHLDFYTKKVLHIKQDFYITNSWITIKHKDVGHHQHNHQNCIFSGVFYLNANHNMAPLKFSGTPGYLKDFNFKYDYEEWDLYNSSTWKLQVKTGTMIIFPSHLDHAVDKNVDNDARIVLGFNSFVKGNFNGEDGEYYAANLKF